MGIGIVALVWLFLAVFGGAVLAAGAWIASIRRPTGLRWRRAGFAFVLPFAMLAWGCPAGLLWIGWGKLTGFNAQFGIGDSWEVSLPNGYTLLFVDIETQAWVHEPRSLVPVLSGVTQIASVADRVYGIAGDSGFVIDTRSRQIQQGPAQTLFVAAALDADAMVPVAQYPGRPRTAIDNIVLALLFFGPPGLLARRYWAKRLRETSERGLIQAG